MGPKRHINQLQYVDYLDPNANKKTVGRKKKRQYKETQKDNWKLNARNLILLRN